MALVATTFPKGPARNAAMAVFAATASIESITGLAVGGLLTEVSWRLVFLTHVPIGLLAIYLSRTTLQETQQERIKLDSIGAVLATSTCTATILGASIGPEKGWLSVTTIGWGAVVPWSLSWRSPWSSAPPRTRSCHSACSSTATGWPRSRPCSWSVA